MRLHCLQHVPFEDAGQIAHWAAERGHTLATTHLYRGQPLPIHDAYDLLVVLGGPMNIYDHDDHSWLVAEKQFMRASLDRGKRLLGVCLGAQLLADVLGGAVTRNTQKEIGWHPVHLLPSAEQSPIFCDWPREFTPFHWHGDTFSIPTGATSLASSTACANQAFVFKEHAVGLQFHLEYRIESIRAMLSECDAEVEAGGPFVQSADRMLSEVDRTSEAHALLTTLLDRLIQ